MVITPEDTSCLSDNLTYVLSIRVLVTWEIFVGIVIVGKKSHVINMFNSANVLS